MKYILSMFTQTNSSPSLPLTTRPLYKSRNFTIRTHWKATDFCFLCILGGLCGPDSLQPAWAPAQLQALPPAIPQGPGHPEEAARAVGLQ